MIEAKQIDKSSSRFIGKHLLLIAMLLAACGICILGGFAAGAYMQYRHKVLLEEDKLARDILVAKICAKSGCNSNMNWIRRDVPLALYSFENDEKLLHATLLRRLYLVSVVTWMTRGYTDIANSPDRFRQDIRTCNCGLESNEEFPVGK